MKRTSKVAHGYSGLTDVTVPGAWNDACPGYWWSEQMKYYWLIFSDCPRFDYRDNYLSTEAQCAARTHGAAAGWHDPFHPLDTDAHGKTGDRLTAGAFPTA